MVSDINREKKCENNLGGSQGVGGRRGGAAGGSGVFGRTGRFQAPLPPADKDMKAKAHRGVNCFSYSSFFICRSHHFVLMPTTLTAD